MSKRMIAELEEVMQGLMDTVNVRDTCDYYAMTTLRDKLTEAFPHMSHGAAGDIAASIDINIDNQYDNADIAKLVDMYSEMIITVVDTMSRDGWSFVAISKSAHKMSLELEY